MTTKHHIFVYLLFFYHFLGYQSIVFMQTFMKLNKLKININFVKNDYKIMKNMNKMITCTYWNLG